MLLLNFVDCLFLNSNKLKVVTDIYSAYFGRV